MKFLLCLKVENCLFQDMICVCGGGKYPIDEINFLTSVLGKFHEDPSLVNLFMGETRAKNGTVVSVEENHMFEYIPGDLNVDVASVAQSVSAFDC